MRYATFFASVGFVTLAVVSTSFSQDKNPQTTPGLVAIGEVSKVDPLKKSFELQSRVDRRAGPTGSDALHGQIQIGIGIGSSRGPAQGPYPPRRDPRFPGDDPIDDTDPRIPAEARHFKTVIYLTEKTVFKSGDKTVSLGDLKTGDTVRVKGVSKAGPQGMGIEASEVIRTPLAR